MEMMIMNNARFGVEIVEEDHWVTVTLTEFSGDPLRGRYDVFATKVYRDRLQNKVDPLNVVWIGNIPREGSFEVQMPWLNDRAGYGESLWFKLRQPANQ